MAVNKESDELLKQIKAYRDDMVARNYPFQQISDIIMIWENKKDLLEEAEKISIYIPTDYSKHPVTYCGMVINSSPYDFK